MQVEVDAAKKHQVFKQRWSVFSHGSERHTVHILMLKELCAQHHNKGKGIKHQILSDVTPETTQEMSKAGGFLSFKSVLMRARYDTSIHKACRGRGLSFDLLFTLPTALQPHRSMLNLLGQISIKAGCSG